MYITRWFNMEELLEKARQGDGKAFEKIVNSIKHELYIIAISRLSDSSVAEDVIQDTIISLYENIYKIREPDKIKKWCIVVLINKCKKIKRKNKIKEISYDEINCDRFLYSRDEYKELIDEVSFFQIIDELSEQDKLITTLFYSSNQTTKEISKILNINESTIRSRISRIRNEIRRKIGDENDKR